MIKQQSPFLTYTHNTYSYISHIFPSHTTLYTIIIHLIKSTLWLTNTIPYIRHTHNIKFAQLITHTIPHSRHISFHIKSYILLDHTLFITLFSFHYYAYPRIILFILYVYFPFKTAQFITLPNKPLFLIFIIHNASIHVLSHIRFSSHTTYHIITQFLFHKLIHTLYKIHTHKPINLHYASYIMKITKNIKIIS